MTQITLNNMRRVFFFIAVVAMMATSAFAQQPTATTERGKLAPTPPMGWMTWNMFKGDISEQLIKETADAMVESGLRDAGYKYVFIDDFWQGGRDNRNNIIPDPKKFPNGIKALADYVHSKGLKLGIYSDAAQLTCGGCTASYGFEEQDARTFASWGVDYLKYDSLMNFNATADFYYMKFKCEMKIRQYQPALNDIAHAIVLTRTEPLYYAEMASLQLRVNRLEDAVKTCDMALNIKGADKVSDFFVIKGIALCELKQKEAGLEALRKAQELADERAEGLIKKYSK